MEAIRFVAETISNNTAYSLTLYKYRLLPAPRASLHFASMLRLRYRRSFAAPVRRPGRPLRQRKSQVQPDHASGDVQR